jgi:hypothetical protein
MTAPGSSPDAKFAIRLKYTGVLGIVALTILWAATALIQGPPGITPPAILVTAFGTMFGAGLGTEAIKEIGGRR